MKIFFSIISCFVLLLTLSGCSGEQPTADALLDQAHKLSMNGNWMQARTIARKAVKAAPENVSAQLMDAIVSDRCGDHERAIEAARKAVQLQPDAYLSLYTLGRLLAGDPSKDEESTQILQRALGSKPSDRDTLVLLTNIAMRANSDRAINYMIELVSRHHMQRNANLQNQIGIYYAQRNNYRSAGPAFVNAYNTTPDNPVVALNLARFMDYYQKNPRKALFFYNRYLDLTVKDPLAAAERESVKKRVRAIGR